MVALGLLLLALMAAFPERLKVPPPIGYLAASTFVLAGLLAVANVFCGRKVRAWLAVLLLACMVLPSAWIAVGPGPRSCSFKLGLLFGFTDGGTCRLAFGIGSVLGLVLVFIALRQALTDGQDER